jgi:hypothetical protein
MHMNYSNRRACGVVSFLALALCTHPASLLSQSIAALKLRDDLRREPFSRAYLTPYYKTADSQIISIVQEEFLLASDPTVESRGPYVDVSKALAARDRKRSLAYALCRMKVDDGTASTYLMKLAEQAITSDAPMVSPIGDDGNEVKGKTSVAFEQWCRAHGVTVKEAATLEILVYPEDVFQIALLEDPKFKGIFEKGVRSNNLSIIGASIEGLVRLDAEESIPGIRAAYFQRARPNAANVIFASSLARFNGESAERMIRKEFKGSPLLPMYDRLQPHGHRVPRDK